jgi:hypothetical protein
MNRPAPTQAIPSGAPRARRIAYALAALLLAAGALHYAPSAHARGYHGGHHHHHHGGRAGAVIGGIVIGAAIARPWYYDRYYYSPPPVVYTPPAAYYPPTTVYSAPAPGPITYIEQPQNYVTAPQAATPQLPVEQRAQRLKAMCDQGLFTPQECATRREEILRGL